MCENKAFTLIELLLVVTIVSILAAVAIPTYDKYIVKTHVSNIFAIANAYKLELVEEVFSGGIVDKAYNIDNDIVSKVSINSTNTDPITYIVEIEAKMKTKDHSGIGLQQPNNATAPLILQLQGINVGEIITWTCNVDANYNDYVPKNCRNNNLIDFN